MQQYNTGNIEKYNSKNPLKRKMVERLNENIISILRQKIGNRKARILDAGCGEGYISRLIAANFPNAEVTGLEYNVEAIRIAEKIESGINYVQGNIMQMPFSDCMFDYVVCTEVLEHLDRPENAFSEILRVSFGRISENSGTQVDKTLHSGVLITVPHEPWFCLGNMLALKNLSRFGNPIDHINHWTYSGFKKWIGNNVGEIIRHVEFSRSFPWSIAWIETD